MPFIFKHNSIDLPHQEQAAQTVTAGSTVSLWGKFDDVFSPLLPSKHHQKEVPCTSQIYIGGRPLGCRGDPLG